MKRQKLLKKSRSAAKFLLTMFVCFASVLAIMPIGVEAASYQGYEWTPIHSKEEFESYCHKAMTKSDGKINTGAEYEPGTKLADGNLPNDSDWFRIMLIYGSSNQRFVSGNSSCNSNKSFLGQVVNTTYGVKLDKKTFTTISGLNTPYIKYQGYDGDNKSNRYFIRFSDNDELGQNYWTMYCKWYGIKYHSACKCEFDRPGRSVNDWKDDANWWSYQTFRWSGDKVEIFYNIDNTADRGWEWWNDGEIRCTQDFDGDYFRICLGRKCVVPVVSTNTTIQPGTTSWNDATIVPDGVVQIPAGATLVIDGTCYNNGIINIEGGSLIIRGVLDQSLDTSGNPMKDANGHTYNTGRISVNSGGVIIVEDTGTLLTRNPNTSYAFYNRSLLYVQGIATFARGITVFDSDIRVDSGAALCIGVIPGKTVAQSTYTKAWIAKNKDSYRLESLCSNGGESTMFLAMKSSIVSKGIYYRNPSVKVSDGSKDFKFNYYGNDRPFEDYYLASDIKGYLKNMQKEW